jgi:hypothetical protein
MERDAYLQSFLYIFLKVLNKGDFLLQVPVTSPIERCHVSRAHFQISKHLLVNSPPPPPVFPNGF